MLNIFNRKKTYVEISPSIVVFTIALLFSLYFLFQIRQIVVIFYLGFIVMIGLSPAVDKLERLIKSRIVSIIIVYFLVGLVLSSILAFLMPPLANQLLQLLKIIDLPYLQEEISTLKVSAQDLNQFADNYANSIGALLDIISSTFQSFFTFLTLIFISFYLMIDEPRLHLKMGWFTENKKVLKIFREFLDELKLQLGGWVRGELILMTVVGVLTYIALSIQGIPFTLPLAIIAGILEVLPNLGPILSAIPAVAVGFLHGGPISALSMALTYLVVQLFENNVLVPKIIQGSADVNPLITIMSILIGFKLYGVIGGLLAIPTYIILRTSFSFWKKYKKKLEPDW